VIALLSHPTTAAQQGLNVITIMLFTGLVFLGVIGLGELVKWRNHRRRDRKYGAGAH
jgi:hypothetical protein